MQPHRNRLGEIGLADDDRDRTVADCVVENDKAGARAGIERHRGFARDGQRTDCVIGKARHRVRLDRDDGVPRMQLRRRATLAASTAGRPCDNLTS